MLGIAKSRIRPQDGSQELLALNQWSAAQVVAMEIKEIEGEEAGGLALLQFWNRAGAGADAILQQLKAGYAVLIEADDLAINDDAFSVEKFDDPVQLRILFLNGHAAAGLHVDVFLVYKEEGAHAVPLHFMEPSGARRQVLAQDSQHRRDAFRHRRLYRTFD